MDTKTKQRRDVPMTPQVRLCFSFHDFRHCASTNLRRAGVDTATAMRIIGHKSEKMWKRYNAIEERDLTQAAEKLDRYLQADTLLDT